MKRNILLSLLVFLTAGIWGQSLQDNEYYQKMVELRDQSRAAFEEGDYAESKRLAEESRGYKALSDAWIEEKLSAYRARSSLVRLEGRLIEVSRWNPEARFPEDYSVARGLYNEGKDLFDQEDYVSSLERSRRGWDVLAAVEPPEGALLPAFYEVRLLPGNTDCLWNIAGYDFVYDNPLLWPRLYEANREKLAQPDNPDLIHPGTVLEIPALSGEQRAGTWTESRQP